MKKVFTIISFIALNYTISAQTGNVGINTITPQATLDVTGVPADATKLDGIIAPRISGDQLNAKTYTSNQTGALVYVNLPLTQTATPQTVDVNGTGYYYFDGTKWVKSLSGNASTEPWNIQGTANPATANTDNIYQNGKVAIGTTSSTAVSTKQLDVLGDFKTQYTDGTNYYGIETNATDLGIPMNTFYVANTNSLASATESTFLFTTPNLGSLQSNYGSGGGSVAVFSSSTGGNVGMVANNSDQSISSSIWGHNDSLTESNVALSHSKQSGEGTTVRLEKLKGVNFNFNNVSGNPEGGYNFPRNNGTANQVLVTDGATPTAQLAWKDISTVNQKIRVLNSGTVAADDYTILVQGNISLPAASSTNTGKIYNLIQDISSNVTISGTLRISGSNFSNYTLNGSANGTGFTVQSTGSAWVLISRY